MKPSNPSRAALLVGLAVAFACPPSVRAQACRGETGTASGTVTVGDGSTPPCDLVDLWAIPETGSWTQLGKFAWGEVAAPMAPGVWRFAAYACGTYFQFRPSAPVRCAKDAQGCVVCPERFDLPMYGMFGGFSGQVTLLPENVAAGPGIPVGAASGLSCGAEKFAYTDDKGRFSITPSIEPHRSNHWGLMVDGDGSARGARTYFLNADYCENGVTATTFSSADVEVNLFRAAPFLTTNDPSMRPLPHAPLLPAMPPHDAGAGISITTGNVAFDQTDLQAWGAGESLVFVRSYNSRTAAHRRQSALGAGWSHTYSAQITVPMKGVLMLNEDDGAPRYFQDMDGDNTYRPSVPVTEASRIEKTASGYVRRFLEGGLEEYDARGRLLKRVDATGRAAALSYDDEGRLAAVVDPDGRRLVMVYGEEGHLRGIGVGDEEIARYTQDEDGRLRGVTYLDGTGFAFTYDDASELLTVAEAGGRTLRTYTYEGSRARTFEVAAGRERLSIEYGPLKTTVTDVLGRVTAYEWSNIHGVRLVTAVAGRCPDCAPAPADRLDPAPLPPAPPIPVPPMASARRPLWARLVAAPWPLTEWPVPAAVDWPEPAARLAERHAWTYDLQGRLLSHRDGSGATRHVAYDMNGLAASVTDDSGRKIRLVRDAAGRLTALATASVVAPGQERTTSFTYDEKGRVAARTESGQNADGTPFKLTTRLGYDPAGRLIRVDGPRTDVLDVITFSYDPAGALVSSAPAEWLLTRFAEHTPLGWPRRIIDPNSRALVYAYDSLGHVRSVDDGGDVTAYEYTGTGRVKKVLRPRGNGIAFTYDAYDRLIEARNAAEHRFLYTYDMAGQRTRDQVRTATGGERERAFDYDRMGRLQRVVVGDGRYELAYDSDGRIVSFRAPSTEPETFEYDSAGRLAAQHLVGGGVIQYRYDIRDRLVAAADSEGGSYSYAYDDLGRATRIVTPSGASTAFGFDLAGDLAWRTDGRGVTTRFERDPLGRTIAVRTPKDRAIVFAYDRCTEGRGRLCEISDQTGQTAFTYTPKGQVLEETRTVGPATFSTGYSYDRNGNLSAVRYPSGRVVTYGWDEADHTRSVSTAAVGPMQTVANVAYGPDGALGGISYANGVSLTFGRDPQGRVRTVRGAPFDVAYSYDARGNVVAINAADRGQSFAYGAGRRLTSASGGWGSLTWSYDEVGNRKSQVGPGESAAYAYDPRTQRLSSVTAGDVTVFGHDAAGRIVRAGEERFIYDEQGQLVMVGAEHRTAEYGYDYKGRRAWKSANGATTVFTYDFLDRLIAESTREGKVIVEYIYEGDAPIARAVRNNVSYVHVDGLGWPVAVTDARAQKIWELDRRPFGDAAAAAPRPRPTPTPVATAAPGRAAPAASEAIVFNLRGGGLYFDEETGLQRTRQRTYDPQLGRYLEPNPCARPGRSAYHNLYAYAGQNPLTFVSPRGVEVLPASGEWAIPAALWDALLPAAGGVSPECSALASTR